MFVRPPARAAVAALSLALAVTASPAHGAASSPPFGSHDKAVGGFAREAASAAHWQGSQLTQGRIHNSQFDFDDWGLTIDTGFALASQGGQPKRLARLTKALEHNYFDSYTTAFGGYYAGAWSKTLLAAKALGANPHNFDGRNLRTRVLGLVARPVAGFESGRVRDRGVDDFSNTFTQSYAVLGLARSGEVPQRVVDYLLKQQCSRGYFRLTEVVGQRCRAVGTASTPDLDATAVAVQALLAARKDGAHLQSGAVKSAVRWLLSVQRRNGSFGGGVQTAGANTNSTGLAAQSLSATGHQRPARKAASWVSNLQITKAKAGNGPARDEIGAVAYNRTALKTALDEGIGASTRDQFRRATPAAVFAFAPKPLGTLTAR